MRTTATHQTKDSQATPTLYTALELDGKSWKLAFSTGLGQRPRERRVGPGDGAAVLREVELAKKRFGLAGQVCLVSCYEAGRDGFWLHRYLSAHGIENVVVDAASIEVPRRWRRAKTDRLDVRKLLERLIKFSAGSREWRVVRVPSVATEDARQLQRELQAVKQERAAVTSRIKSLLATQGVKAKVAWLPSELEALRLWDGSPLPPHLRERLEREWEHWRFLTQRLQRLQRGRRDELRTEAGAAEPATQQILLLQRVCAVGEETAHTLTRELFWREPRNRGEVAALAGLTPTPYASGGMQREQGISKAGSRRVRHVAIELAWFWLRYQPQSDLSRWYQERFGGGGARQRKIGIVALARKLLIVLWRYVQSGTLPADIRVKLA
jgi:transposase